MKMLYKLFGDFCTSFHRVSLVIHADKTAATFEVVRANNGPTSFYLCYPTGAIGYVPREGK